MSKKMKWRSSNLNLASIGVVSLFFLVYVTQQSCNGDTSKEKSTAVLNKMSATDTAIVPILSGRVPSEVKLPINDSNSDVNNRPFFDQFSWQSFIALSWPVVPGQRGQPLNPNDPNTFLQMTNTTQVVWTTYKNQWDLFGQRDKKPSPWNSWDDPVNPCSNSQTFNHIFFGSAKGQTAMFSGETNESFSVPLIDQNKNYALFEIRYNEPQYDFIVNNGLYFATNLFKYQQKNGGVVTMPISTAATQGSILVKAAWKIITDQDDQSRYYIIDEMIYDPVSNQCSKQRMGLVGLHIAQKVDTFPQWIWSSFEQVDNVPGTNAKAPYSFNNGRSLPTTDEGFTNQPESTALNPNKASRLPVQVTRFNAIPATPANLSTVDINALYQAAVGKTWMRYYQLVTTQWPTNPQQFKLLSQNGIYPGDCGQPFPVDGCVNTTMETYFQSPKHANAVGGSSCMSCHYTAGTTDFSWSLRLRSHINTFKQ